jgi:hypothetical protein
MNQRILIMGLPRPCNTLFAQILTKCLGVQRSLVLWSSADAVRRRCSDWNSSMMTSIRQVHSTCALIAHGVREIQIPREMRLG